MFDRILRQLRNRVRTRQYVMTLHGEEEMDEDGFTIFDVESGILMGTITERQKDAATGEWKYLIQGETVAGDDIAVVAKLGPTGMVVIITVYRP